MSHDSHEKVQIAIAKLYRVVDESCYDFQGLNLLPASTTEWSEVTRSERDALIKWLPHISEEESRIANCDVTYVVVEHIDREQTATSVKAAIAWSEALQRAKEKKAEERRLRALERKRKKAEASAVEEVKLATILAEKHGYTITTSKGDTNNE